MLVLSRRIGERIVLPTADVTIQVVEITRGKVRLGITAPDSVPVHRTEIWRRICASGQSPPRGNGNGTRIPRVLIADSDSSLLAGYQQFLSQNGFEVETATGGVDCLARLRQRAPDVLVLELDLPWGGADGILALMRQQPDVPLVPVLIHASRRGPHCLGDDSFPVACHASRPLAPSRLAARIRQLAARPPQPRPANPPSAPPADVDASLARWIAQRTGGRLQSLRVESLPERVIVHGRTRSYYARQLTQAAVAEALGTLPSGSRKTVEFDIKVVPDPLQTGCR